MLAAELGCFACGFELVGGPNGVERKRRPALLSAVGAVADAGAKGLSARGDLHLPAKAFAREQLLA